jgi:hypothetical protein
MEDTDLGLEEIERYQEMGAEDIRRLLRDAYQQGFEDGMAFMQPGEQA